MVVRTPGPQRATSPAIPARCVMPSDAFTNEVLREQVRTERRGLPFSILVFTTYRESNEPRVAVQGRLIDVLSRRLRITDVVGEVGRQRVALLLPDTHRDGACALACQIGDLAAAYKLRLRFDVSTYPPIDGDAQWPFTPGSFTAESSAIEQLRRRGFRASDNEPSSLVASTVATGSEIATRPHPAWKRAFDLLVASIMLIAAAPIMLVIAVLIRLTSGGPILFRQQRDGQGSQPFEIYKFRTMRVGAELEQAELRERNEQDGPAFKIENDPRITTIGRFLRKSCLDELPQLFNVLRGDMSIVGPRPLPCAESRQCAAWQSRRMEVKPGLTCFWQSMRSNEIPFAEWMRMDLRYVREMSLLTDLRLILATALTILGIRRASWRTAEGEPRAAH